MEKYQEFKEELEIFKKHVPDFENFMENLFLDCITCGTCLFDGLASKEDLIRANSLCYHHFLEKEDYRKVAAVYKIICSLNTQKRVQIDESILNSIDFFLN